MLASNKSAQKVGRIPIADRAAYETATEESTEAIERVDEAQLALFTTKPTTLAGVAAVLAYVAAFWIEGDESSEKGLPIYEPLSLDRRDEMLSAGASFLPMIADRLKRLS